MTSIGERIKLRRSEKGITVAALAERVGVSRGYIHSLENGTTKNPSAEILYNIAVEISTTIEDLLDQQELVSNYADIPASLDEFAKKEGLSEQDIQMLANIRYQGRRPRTPEDWSFIYEFIKRTLR
ncbi:MAG: helix-turn-helix domain-containing protein [Aggregatilineales bacterium]